MNNKYLSLFIILTITFLASAIGGYTTSSFKEPWYSQLTLAPFNPPAWIFGPVWTILYIMMSVAIWKIWQSYKDTYILKIYFIHLFFNSTWSIIFFGFHQVGLALVNLIIILGFVVLLLKLYFKRDKISYYLMIPYFLWSSFALILNTYIFIYN